MKACELEARERARLRTSELCCALFIARGTTSLTIAEIVSEIGVSQRTFYRYFTIKAESVGPVFDWTIRQSNAVIVQADPDLALTEALHLAFRASLMDDSVQRTQQLFPLVFRNPEMWSVFMRKVHDGELSVAPLLAHRLRLAADSIAARCGSRSEFDPHRARRHGHKRGRSGNRIHADPHAVRIGSSPLLARAASQGRVIHQPDADGRYKSDALIEQH